jgi:glycosyltransferase involved in cell wall biosynthesis
VLAGRIVESLVSVVIPSHNAARYVAETLESVLSQTWPRLEVIVVDDGSTDGTEEVLRPFRDRIVYVRQENQGLAGARNAGMARATGELVAWLDADDLWTPEKVALQIDVLRRHPECVLVASDFSAFGEDGLFERSHAGDYFGAIRRTPGGLAGLFTHREELDTRGGAHLGTGLPERVVVYWGDMRRKLLWGNVLLPSTVLFRRDAATKAGALDPVFRRDTDSEYLLRVSAHGSVAFVDHPLIRYRYSPGQMSSDAHLADVALSRLVFLESAVARDPALLSDAAFRRRLGYSHLAAANALADVRRVEGARHLLRSVAYGWADAVTVRTAAKLLLPRRIARVLRKPSPR